MATTFLTTDLGLALEAASLLPGGIEINPSYIEFGEGKYNPVGDETGLTTPFNPRRVYQINAHSSDEARATINALISDAEVFNAYEIGLFVNGTFNANGVLQSDGVLYALAAHTLADGVLLVKAASDIIVFQGGVTYSNQPNFTEGTVVLAPIATENLDGLVRRATRSDAEDGLENTKFTTPLRVAQALAANLSTSLTNAIVSLLATMSQAISGTSNTKLMTPLRVRQAMGDYVADFAKMGSTTDISTALIPNSIARDNEIAGFAKTGSSVLIPFSKIDITESDDAPISSDGSDGDYWVEY